MPAIPRSSSRTDKSLIQNVVMKRKLQLTSIVRLRFLVFLWLRPLKLVFRMIRKLWTVNWEWTFVLLSCFANAAAQLSMSESCSIRTTSGCTVECAFNSYLFVDRHGGITADGLFCNVHALSLRSGGEYQPKEFYNGIFMTAAWSLQNWVGSNSLTQIIGGVRYSYRT